MFKTKSFRVHWSMEDSLARDLSNFLNNNCIGREDIIDIKYAVNSDWLYCMLVWNSQSIDS